MTSSTASEEENQVKMPLHRRIAEEYKEYLQAVAVVLVAAVLVAPLKVLSTAWHVAATALGVALGLGIGLGLAMHVYQQLEDIRVKYELEKRRKKKRKSKLPRLPQSSSNAVREPSLEDSASYVSLMFLAGYPVEDKVLRGQVLRENSPFWDVEYKFTDVEISEQRAPTMMKQDWPSLPPQIATELGRFIEHIMRDFIAGWYSKVDGGCVFREESEKRKEGILSDGRRSKEFQELENEKESQANPMQRKMVFSTMTHRRIPMLDQTYRLMTQVFGNLATRAEHVNVFSLVLLKWTQVLARTFRVYRALRTSAKEKNETANPTEVQITREFLLSGKLHRAITFGLDVPSLLFADASGEECGTGTNQAAENPMQVLEERLYNTPLLRECELDYNRMLANRLVRALLPKGDCSSPVTIALLVELFGNFVLLPIMNIFSPLFLNTLVVQLCDRLQGIENTNTTDETNIGSFHDEEPSKNAAEEAKGTAQSKPEAKSSRANVSVENETTKDGGRSQLEIDTATTQSDDVRPSRSSMTRTSLVTPTKSQDADESNSHFVEDPVGDLILKLVSSALDKMQKHINVDSRQGIQEGNDENRVDWDNSDCQAAVLKLVMLVEAILLHGRCQFRKPMPAKGEEVERSTETDSELSSKEDLSFGESLPQLLMEMTSNMASFEAKINQTNEKNIQELMENSDMDFEPAQDEVSTLRTLVSTWLHSGQLSRALSLLVKGFHSIFAPFYSTDAFLSSPENAEVFASMFDALNGVEIMVETMAVLSSPRLDLEIESSNLLASSASKRTPKAWSVVKSASSRVGPDGDQWSMDPTSHFNTMTTPRYLDFHKNLGFASSLREERERRTRSWVTRKWDDSIQCVHRKTSSNTEIELHQELHNLARNFYNGTNYMCVRDAVRKNGDKVALMTVEVVSNKRRIEVPDDDSSFLLRAQPRALSPVSVHRDDRNHDLSYKCFSATYEELSSGAARYNNGRYLRQCFLQYYPTDRTASIAVHNDARKIDKRKGKSRFPDAGGSKSGRPVPFISPEMLRKRHLCQKWAEKKETSVSSFFSSTVMEVADFNAVPRTGKAIDFIYRMSLFDQPAISIAGKRFLVQDSASRGAHRADASAMEITDASLSALLLLLGREYQFHSRDDQSSEGFKHDVEWGPDGYPMVFMKSNKKQGDQVSTEMKPYRASFVRAALMVTSARQEAQLQCLKACVLAGSAKSATRGRIELYLKPTLKILSFANDRGSDRSRISSLLRDLKLGVYHIDREQLRRNGLLSPRNPTTLLELKAEVEEAVEAKDVPYPIGGKMPPATILYKVRCNALVAYSGDDDEEDDIESYLDEGQLPAQFRESWVVYRTIKDFQSFHKHIKTQVALKETSAGTGSRLVGAATAAFVATTQGRRARNVLVPSLSKTGGLALTKNAVIQRGELLSEYLGDLLLSENLINGCMELLLFLGAAHPFPPEVKVMQTPSNYIDPLGRSCFERKAVGNEIISAARSIPRGRVSVSSTAYDIPSSTSTESIDTGGGFEGVTEQEDKVDQIPAILNKVDQVPLAEVRNRIVELVRSQFGFENASFFRSQLLAALETASFVAMTKTSTFRSLMHDLHTRHLNPEALARLVQLLIDIIWPDGVFMAARTPLTAAEEVEMKKAAQTKLLEIFPEQISAVLGDDLTKDGLDMVHEMLQNRVVVKSLFYMLVDLLWIEVFPELRDSLSGDDPLNR
ncbi:unnamed protein product [Cylindrotheca closterium]|uniref:RUN domain-containing protein n=1 Tax=Cylindrotheca closterium TaxID=2856 RepID=A0AAD2FWU9_9STRA|nr:unnamed protein product [Cylindrotheca closterium]